jgi:hypothetical protein
MLAMHAIMASAAWMTMAWLVIMKSTNDSLLPVADAFVAVRHRHHHHHSLHPAGGCGSNNINIMTFLRGPTTRGAVGRRSRLNMAQISQGEAQKAIDTVVATLRNDAAAKKDLGTLDKVTVVLGYGR